MRNWMRLTLSTLILVGFSFSVSSAGLSQADAAGVRLAGAGLPTIDKDARTATGPITVTVNSSGWADVSAGGDATCATRADGTLWCWGMDVGTGQINDVPVQVGTASSWETVSVGNGYACATRADGTLWCWGYNGSGELGTGDTTSRPSPAQVGTATSWATVATSDGDSANHTCATRTDGTLWCWGDNFSGGLGTGDTTGRLTPTQIGSATSWATVSVVMANSCAIATDGALWCWGYNGYGQLGTGDTTDRLIPTQVGTATMWTAVAAEPDSTCATRIDGTLWCWGYNGYGQLGTGDTTDRLIPTQVGTVTSWATVGTLSAGDSCATRTDGTLWCWGNNGVGQLGTGDMNGRLTPTQIGTATTWKAASGGFNYDTCATRTDGTLWCWGHGWDGQLGVGGGADESAPTRVTAPQSSATSLNLSAATVTYGNEQAEKISAAVSSASSPTGTVTAETGTTTLCTITLLSGSGSCSPASTALPAGSYQVVGAYSGDATTDLSVSPAQSLTVAQATSATSLSLSAQTVAYGSEQTEHVSVAVSGPAVPGGTVSVRAGTVGLCVIALAAGGGSCSLPATVLPAGAYHVTGFYSGDSNHGASASTPQALTVAAVKVIRQDSYAGYSAYPASGYVLKQTAQWIVPKVTCPISLNEAPRAAVWVGLWGTNSAVSKHRGWLPQIGTSSDCGTGIAFYRLAWEMYSDITGGGNNRQFGLDCPGDKTYYLCGNLTKLSPGDSVRAAVTFLGPYTSASAVRVFQIGCGSR